MKYKRVLFFYIIFFIGAALSFGFGYMARMLQDITKPSKFPILQEAYQVLQDHAYDALPEGSAIEYGMIRGMVDAYADPFTRFVEPVQHELETDQLSGSYGGIGAGLDYDPDRHVILHPFPEGPAKDAGILDGDRLLKVDDWEIPPDTPLDQVVAAIRGPEGERVNLEIARPPDYRALSFRIKREHIPLPSVTWHLDAGEPRLGLIVINVIASTTSDEIQTAVEELTTRGATRFAVDLRGNHGGLLTAGVDIARLFLEEGVVIQEHYRGQEIKTYQIEQPGPLVDLPMVVLVDANTASAAEIVAGALKMQHRAPIIGTHTFGKDSIQLVFNLKDESSLHVTAAKWWVPNLESPIGEGGLEPDIWISMEDTEDDPFIQAAIQALFTIP